MTEKMYPRAFSHIGITVPDIQKAVDFYEQVMGWYVIMPPSTVKEENETAIGQMCIDVEEGGGPLKLPIYLHQTESESNYSHFQIQKIKSPNSHPLIPAYFISVFRTLKLKN